MTAPKTSASISYSSAVSVWCDALFGPVGRHPWVNEAGKVDAAKAGTWMANIILMAGGSPKTAFACALEVVTDITDNPAKFKDFAPLSNDKTEPQAPQSNL